MRTNIPQLESDLAATKRELDTLLAATAHREPTSEERERIQRLLAEGKRIGSALEGQRLERDQIEAMNRLLQGDGLTPAGPAHPRGGRSLGAQFIASNPYRQFKTDKLTRGSQWAFSTLLDLRAATVSEDPTSGGALVLPQRIPGILPLPTAPVVIADLFAPGVTNSNAVTFMREKTFTNAAAPTLEGGTKPESALVFEAVTDPVRKIAHWLPVTEEMLEDEPTIASYIDARLRVGVQLVEEDQLLNGNGTAPNVLGLANTPGLSPALAQGAGEPVVDLLARQIAAVQLASQLAVTGIIMHPSDYALLPLAKDTTQNYLSGGGPFAAPVQPVIWGKPVALSTVCTPGSAWVGAFRIAGQVFKHTSGIRVEASNSHVDFFIKNLVAIRAEERLVLAVYRPSAFAKITFTTIP
jgi:HK97 family phage major capsid protein